MSHELQALAITAASIGFVHTLTGPDHYLPFIAMSRARGWSARRTALITLLCGAGHVMSSVLLGLVGILLGAALARLELFESVRGDIAAWMLTAFGFTYFVWGLHRAFRRRPHRHLHDHDRGLAHEHEHCHEGDHAHPHGAKANITPWVLFTIFVFGPCEPLIPILMYPAATKSGGAIALVTLIFALATIGTMLSLVMAGLKGLSLLPFKGIARYAHALAGASLALCGFAILFLGL